MKSWRSSSRRLGQLARWVDWFIVAFCQRVVLLNCSGVCHSDSVDESNGSMCSIARWFCFSPFIICMKMTLLADFVVRFQHLYEIDDFHTFWNFKLIQMTTVSDSFLASRTNDECCVEISDSVDESNGSMCSLACLLCFSPFLTCMKVTLLADFVVRFPHLYESDDWDIYTRNPLIGLSMSTSVWTWKMVSYAREGRIHGKLRWRFIAILTCKSPVLLGNRGERLL